MILYLDTASEPTIISLLDKNKKKLAQKKIMSKFVLSEKLLGEINSLHKKTGIKISEVEQVYVNSGPGSYTGVRIGTTVANFLAYSLNIPVFVAGDGLDLTFPGGEKTGFLCPVLPVYKNPPHITQKKTRLR